MTRHQKSYGLRKITLAIKTNEAKETINYQKITSDADINILVPMAHEIWHDHFKAMFDSKTLPKLIEGAQSKKVILSQIKNGYQYFFIIEGEKKLGYFAYKIDHDKNELFLSKIYDKNELFLSKIYIYANQRGKGTGKNILKHLESVAHDAGVGKITLTVYHKNTNSIRAYKRWGFSDLGLIKRHFDTGLVFDDVSMEKVVSGH